MAGSSVAIATKYNVCLYFVTLTVTVQKGKCTIPFLELNLDNPLIMM